MCRSVHLIYTSIPSLIRVFRERIVLVIIFLFVAKYFSKK